MTGPVASEKRALRTITHSGPKNPARFHFARTRVRRVETIFPAGRSIAESVAELMHRENCAGGILELSGGRLDPFSFVIPAEDPNKNHAVWYSDTRTCAGGVSFEKASVSFGLHDGAPFFHCHGLWRTAAGEQLGGHLLPDDNRIVEPVAVTALLAVDARFERRFDAETSFELFAVAGGGQGEGVLATIRPNVDIISQIEELAAATGIRAAHVHGVGSLIDMTLADGRSVESLALEVAIADGRIVPSGCSVRVEGLKMAGVGMDGKPFEGELRRSCNNVCVTFEILLEPAAQ